MLLLNGKPLCIALSSVKNYDDVERGDWWCPLGEANDKAEFFCSELCCIFQCNKNQTE